ncbi:MAG: PadR family transcriptional regulator [Candidatus Heimdallarchaeota archaeon]
MSDIIETAAIKRLQKKLTKETLFMYILRLLQDKEHYGYELRQEIKNRFGFTMATVTSYVILYQMEREKLVISKKKKSPKGRPSRKYYKITDKGSRVMTEAKKILTDTLGKVFDKTSEPKR